MRTCGVHPPAKPETSRFPCKELPHMPGSVTTPERRALALSHLPMLPSVLSITSASGSGTFRGSMAGLCGPLSTLRRYPREYRRMTRGPVWLSGRGAGYPTPPPQIPACGFPAPGSLSKVDRDRPADPQARCFSDMLSPAPSPEHALRRRLPFDRPPSLHHLRRRFQSALFEASHGTMQPSDSSPRSPAASSPRLPVAARDRRCDCGPDEVSQVPTRSFRT